MSRAAPRKVSFVGRRASKTRNPDGSTVVTPNSPPSAELMDALLSGRRLVEVRCGEPEKHKVFAGGCLLAIVGDSDLGLLVQTFYERTDGSGMALLERHLKGNKARTVTEVELHVLQPGADLIVEAHGRERRIPWAQVEPELEPARAQLKGTYRTITPR